MRERTGLENGYLQLQIRTITFQLVVYVPWCIKATELLEKANLGWTMMYTSFQSIREMQRKEGEKCRKFAVTLTHTLNLYDNI